MMVEPTKIFRCRSGFTLSCCDTNSSRRSFSFVPFLSLSPWHGVGTNVFPGRPMSKFEDIEAQCHAQETQSRSSTGSTVSQQPPLPLISTATRQRLTADYSSITGLMVQLDGQTKIFKQRYEGLLETKSDLTRLSTLLDETRVDQLGENDHEDQQEGTMAVSDESASN
jgi:hypothetical protein